tara:strand:- start:10 stop:282 length:273 start_codon:yes stop_codon:yes gene_type:complete
VKQGIIQKTVCRANASMVSATMETKAMVSACVKWVGTENSVTSVHVLSRERIATRANEDGMVTSVIGVTLVTQGQTATYVNQIGLVKPTV